MLAADGPSSVGPLAQLPETFALVIADGLIVRDALSPVAVCTRFKTVSALTKQFHRQVWRCTVLWNGNKRILLVLCILLLATTSKLTDTSVSISRADTHMVLISYQHFSEGCSRPFIKCPSSDCRDLSNHFSRDHAQRDSIDNTENHSGHKT